MNHKPHYQFPGSEILIFTKAPVPGEVKTRIAEKAGSKMAASLSALLTEHAVKTAVESEVAPVTLWVANGVVNPFIQKLVKKYSLSIFKQGKGNLGQKMSDAFDQSLSSSQSTILIGTDCPFIDKAYLQLAFTKLSNHRDMVIGPALDGGYVLVGLLENDKRLFEGIQWSHETVLKLTHKQAQLCGYHIKEVDTLSDIDYFEDIQTWQPSITSVPALQEWLDKQKLGEIDE